MKRFVTNLLMVLCLGPAAEATDRFFSDIHVSSPSGRFRVDATSPDNKSKAYRAFQASFTYKCVDTSNGKTMWTRQQPMEKPQQLSRGSDAKVTLPKEASPVAIYVADSGWTVVRTAWDDLILVSLHGVDTGKIDLLEDALTEAENTQFVHDTTAGPMWTGMSAWYYVQIPAGEFFVIRPWWGRRVLVDIEKGTLAHDSKALSEAARKTESKLVISALQSDRKPKNYELSKYTAAYLAGNLSLKHAVPLLKIVEQSNSSGSSTTGGLSFGKAYHDEVDPHTYSTYSLRQVAQLSLRRLGEIPKPLPCYTFKLVHGGRSQPFTPPARKQPRHETIQAVEVGMSAKQVLTLVGSPDFVGYDSWSYDMDANDPFSVTLTFDARKVTKIERTVPLWKSGFARDQAL